MADELSMETCSLVGRRVEIYGLSSPQGQRLNGQLGVVIAELDARRLGVRLEQGTKSIKKSNIRVKPLREEEVGHDIFMAYPFEKWPAEAAVFLNFQLQEHFLTGDAEENGRQMHTDYQYNDPPKFSFVNRLESKHERILHSALTHGLTLNGLLKVMLRLLAGIEPESFNALDKHGRGETEAATLIRLLQAAEAAGREAELVSQFDSTDLLRAVLAADRVGSLCSIGDLFFHRSQDAIPALRALAASLFRCGVCIRGLAEQAKSTFCKLCEDLADEIAGSDFEYYRDEVWLRSQMNQGSFNRRVDMWCKWEQQQWRLTVRTLGHQGLGLRDPVPALIADFVAGTSVVSNHCTTSHYERGHYEGKYDPQVVRELHHNEPPRHIDEQVARSEVHLETEVWWVPSVVWSTSSGEHLRSDAADHIM